MSVSDARLIRELKMRLRVIEAEHTEQVKLAQAFRGVIAIIEADIAADEARQRRQQQQRQP